MSIGFGKSYQKAGLNRLGAYLSVANTKGPPADRNVCPTNIEKPNEIWRRYTGIFPGVELETWQRKRGLRILARRVRERIVRECGGTAATEVATTKKLSLAAEWEFAAEDWVRVREEGISVEAVCVELGCSRARLT